MLEATVGFLVLFGYCSGTSSSPFSLYFCGSLLLVTQISVQRLRKVQEPLENSFLFLSQVCPLQWEVCSLGIEQQIVSKLFKEDSRTEQGIPLGSIVTTDELQQYNNVQEASLVGCETNLHKSKCYLAFSGRDSGRPGVTPVPADFSLVFLSPPLSRCIFNTQCFPSALF